MPRPRLAAALSKYCLFNQVCGIETMELRSPLDRENPISHVICHGTRYHQGARRQDMTATEILGTLRCFWLKHYDAMEVLIMNWGTEFGAALQHLCQYRILPVVTDLETPWQNSVDRRVRRAGFSTGQRASGRQLRLPFSLLEGDAIDPYTIVEDDHHEMRRSEIVRVAAAHGCVVAADL